MLPDGETFLLYAAIEPQWYGAGGEEVPHVSTPITAGRPNLKRESMQGEYVP
jgi:hypothetical protein